jgi:hypothetical protein
MEIRKSIRSFDQWQVIAAKIGTGANRSPQMIKNLLRSLINKTTKLGIVITEPEDVYCIPRIAFHRLSLSPQQVRQSFELAKLARFKPNQPAIWQQNASPKTQFSKIQPRNRALGNLDDPFSMVSVIVLITHSGMTAMD